MRYITGTGYFAKPGSEQQCEEFFHLWHANVLRYSKPERIIVLAVGGSEIKGAPGEWIKLSGNLGHTHDLTNHIKPHCMCGWSAAFVTLAMIAYANETDFIFHEQDCLAFGPWVEEMYCEMGGLGMVFGRSKKMACAQSLCLVRHAFIPEFVRLYMATGSEQDKENECELKFARLEKENFGKFGTFGFGVDRDRPIPYGAKVFYAQQLSAEELAEMKRRGLI